MADADTPRAERGAFKRLLLATFDRPRTRADVAAQFGPQGVKCLNNLALRREVRRVPGSSPAAYIDRRHARAYLDGVTTG